ncbi:MAG: hypothetical protein AB4038_05685 [Prochloraceae cyanobacterium]
MNKNTLILVACSVSVLAATLVLPQTLIHLKDDANDFWENEQFQETTINVNAANLRQPHILTVSSSTSSLNGQIKLNGRVLKNIRNRGMSMNLSPHLRSGENIIEISGNYSPANSSVQLKFIGPNTQVNQQTGGSGEINQVLIIYVE